MEGRQLGDDCYGPAEEGLDENGRRISPSSPPRESSSSSLVSSLSVSSSSFSSRLESFEYLGGYSPHCECEEIPSMRWLTRSFGWTPSRRSRGRTEETRSPPTNGLPPAAGPAIHVDWKERLPPDYKKILRRAVVPVTSSSLEELYDQLCHPILIDKGKKSFSFDKITGKKCYMMSARDLDISSQGPSPTWSSNGYDSSPISILESSLKSRFSRVARITQSGRQIRIVGKIGVRELSPGTTYAAYLVFESSFSKSPSYQPLSASVKVGDQFISGHSVWLQPEEVPTKDMGPHGWMKKVGDFVVDVGEQPWPGKPRQRIDGWMDVALGDVFVNHGNKEEMVIIRLDTNDATVGDLVIEGIDVRPKYDRGKARKPATPWKFTRRDPLFSPSRN